MLNFVLMRSAFCRGVALISLGTSNRLAGDSIHLMQLKLRKTKGVCFVLQSLEVDDTHRNGQE